MITKITGEAPFQVLTSNFSISPSQEGYTLQISADGVNFSNLFTVGAGVTRLVTGVAANSYYRLSGNESEVVINWQKMCVTDGGGSGGSGTTYTAGDYIDLTGDVISVTGITPDLYLTSADTENFLTNYWNSAVTEQHIESAASITYASGASYTDQEVQSAYTILDDHITEVEEIAASGYTELHAGLMEVSGRTSLTSGDVQTQIDASISGKADAANIGPNAGSQKFPKWNKDGIVTGEVSQAYFPSDYYINGVRREPLFNRASDANARTYIYAPVSAGTAGQVLVSTGNGAPVWSAVTGPDMSLYTPTSGFSTINGSAITAGGNIEIQAGGDMSAYWTSAQTQSALTSVSGALQTQIDTIDEVVGAALVDLNDRVAIISAATPTVDLSGYYTSAQTEQAITSKNYVTSAQVETQITNKNYALSADVTTLVNSAFSYTNEIERVTASAYTELHDDILALSGAGYVTSGQVETQITGKHYTTSSDQSVINIVKISQTAYNTLVSQSATTSTTLYVVVPDSQ